MVTYIFSNKKVSVANGIVQNKRRRTVNPPVALIFTSDVLDLIARLPESERKQCLLKSA